MSQIRRKFSLLSIPTGLFSVLVFTTFLSNPTLPGIALELPNGQTVFERSPRLVRAATSYTRRNNPAATYQFTIEVPEGAGEALKAVKIEQRQNYIDMITFQQEDSQAFIGDSFAGGQALSLEAIGGASQPGEITVVFAEPVPPGTTVTVAVKPKRNPFSAGVYLFGVTAFPEGENSLGLYLGSGRLHIYDS